MAGWVRRVALLAAAVFAVAAPALGAVLGLPQSIAGYAAQGDDVVRAAPYAFAVWGLLYLWLLVYAVRQLLSRAGGVETRLGWPAFVAFATAALWVLAAQADQVLAPPLLIVAGAAALTLGLWQEERRAADLAWPDRLLTLWPLTLLAGWLCTAAPLNVVGTLLRTEVIAPPAARWLAAGLLLAVAALAWALTRRLRDGAFALTPAWGFAAVAVAMWGEDRTLGALALALAVLAIVAAAAAYTRRR